MDEHIDALDCLSQEQRDSLKATLAKCPTLTKGGSGKLNIPPAHLELRDDAKPHHAKAFPIPKFRCETTRKEIDCFCDIGALEKNHDSEWGAPSFVRPKKLSGGSKIGSAGAHTRTSSVCTFRTTKDPRMRFKPMAEDDWPLYLMVPSQHAGMSICWVQMRPQKPQF